MRAGTRRSTDSPARSGHPSPTKARGSATWASRSGPRPARPPRRPNNPCEPFIRSGRRPAAATGGISGCLQVDGKGKTARSFGLGRLLAARAKEKGITKVVFDRGGSQYNGRVKAVADGARKGGLEL